MSNDKKNPPRKPKFEFNESGEITQESWNKVMNWYEDYNQYERMAATLAPEIREMDKRAAELKKEANEEREKRMLERARVEKLLEQNECASCGVEAGAMRGKKVLTKEWPGQWICQKCAKRTCRHCGAPLEQVPGLDFIDEEQMRVLHSPILPVSYQCIDKCQQKESK